MNVPFERLVEIDRRINEYFASHNNPRLRRAFRALTHFGTGAVWITIYALLLILFYNQFTRLIWALILAEGVGLLIVIILRYATKRERPIARYESFSLTPWNRYSFPSHHTLRSFMIAVVVGTDSPGLLPFLVVMAAAVGFSRIYLSKHYFSDVLVGALLGAFVGTASQRFI
jgi:undecaprenyl-diphosphatase